MIKKLCEWFAPITEKIEEVKDTSRKLREVYKKKHFKQLQKTSHPL